MLRHLSAASDERISYAVRSLSGLLDRKDMILCFLSNNKGL